MKVKVDQEKCQGHNRCFVVASELFELDDYGYAHEVGDGTVPPGLEEKARLLGRKAELALASSADNSASGRTCQRCK